MVIPSGALSDDKTKWNASHPAFYLPVRKLSAAFRDKLLFYLRKAERDNKLVIPQSINDLHTLLKNLKTIKWVVHSQPPEKTKSNPQYMIRYLSRYVNKTAVSEHRIKKLEKGCVHLSYIDRKRNKAKTEIISEKLFMQRLAIHILPKGFKKVRFYGFIWQRPNSQSELGCEFSSKTLPLSKKHACIVQDADKLFYCRTAGSRS